jgi:hypothetical protein
MSRVAMLLLAAAASISCRSEPAPTNANSSRGTMSTEQRSDAAGGQGATASAALTRPADWIEYAAGIPTFHGRTTVHVAGDGSAWATFEQGGKTDRHEGKLDPALLERVRRTLAQNDPTKVASTRTVAQPDEARITITVQSGAGQATSEAWDNDQWSNESLRALVVLFQDVAKQVSGGKISY